MFGLRERNAVDSVPSFYCRRLPVFLLSAVSPVFVLQHEGWRRSTDKHEFAHAGVLIARVYSLMASEAQGNFSQCSR